ncbi:type II toxin-antitoxin system HicB family antitoxin [Comamonas sp. NLF-1-9]|uniref:type II toxin-antitoxin system HicB family antitoxin n=1 Tax=Comamonas sp. NLF-1-9 TaxID=2853163 RepID=UPI001C491198|nr:type II toxin-antitoxin system HicB family antitoxin [Comamonas sp. NLF-1-9]QXL84748.1 type II toxin-antitoxin system HicB family antitoxin [Comamonas sp. NLF-1-9]
MNTMTHKGYTARVGFDERDAIFAGRILGIADVIGFHGETVAELRAAFEEAVDDYLATCAKSGKQPLKPASGNMMLRVPPEVHLQAQIAAQARGQSLNQWAAEVFRNATLA